MGRVFQPVDLMTPEGQDLVALTIVPASPEPFSGQGQALDEHASTGSLSPSSADEHTIPGRSTGSASIGQGQALIRICE